MTTKVYYALLSCSALRLCGLGGYDGLLCPERLRNPFPFFVLEGKEKDRSRRPLCPLDPLEVHPPIRESVLEKGVLTQFIEHPEVELAALLPPDQGLANLTRLERLFPTIGIDAGHHLRVLAHPLVLN